jgi:phage gp36-like protein
MAYAVQSDLVPLRLTLAELVQLTDDENTGQVNATTVAAALEEASGRVDSYCRTRYVTPLQVGDDVKGMTLDIGTYLLFSRRRNFKTTETIRQRYEDAIAFLKDISVGKASLDQPVSQTAPQSSTAGPQISDRDRHLRFRDHNIEGYV